MQTAHRPDDVVAWAEVEVVGVAEDHAGAHRFEIERIQGFYGGEGTHRHEGRSFDKAVRSCENS
jgi:hypothetical protein